MKIIPKLLSFSLHVDQEHWVLLHVFYFHIVRFLFKLLKQFSFQVVRVRVK